MSIFNYLTIGSMLLMIFLILIQTRGASLGAGLGGAVKRHRFSAKPDQGRVWPLPRATHL